MLKDLQTLEEIEEYFSGLDNNTGDRIQRAQIYGMAYEQQQYLLKQEEIEKLIKNERRRILRTTIISDDMAIVEAEYKPSKEVSYYPVVFGKFHNESCMSFDEALVVALSRKYGHDRSAPHMIYNMLRMDLGARKPE